MVTKVAQHKSTSEGRLVGLCSEWVGDSQFRLRAREIGRSDKIIVDVTELSHQRMQRKGTALKVARNFVRQFGVASVDATQLCDYSFTKRSFTLDGDECRVKIRQSSFVFHRP